MILFNDKKVLIIAPHMDDEIIGCSGTIILNRDLISKLVVVYLTSDLRRIEENNIIADILKIDQRYLLNFKDGFISQSYESGVYQLINIIQLEHPDYVFIPHKKDNHVDHIASNYIAMDALGKARYWKTEHSIWKPEYVFEYGVWSFQNDISEIIDISTVFDKKIALMKIYQSQIEDFDYIRYIQCYNGYCGLLFNKKGVAECFTLRRI